MKSKKNPYIENLCRAMIERKGEKLPPDAMERLIDDLYRLFENMLGRNMVAALPEEIQSNYISQYEKGRTNIDYDEIAQIFEENISNPQEIMKKTIKEFTEIYFKNR